MHIRSKDTVVVITGKDKGKEGKVLVASPKTGKVVAADVKGIQERRPGRGMGPGPRPQCPVTGCAPGTNPDCPMAGGFRHPGFHGYHHW